jgi:haloalkane dehalogenase
MVQDWGGPIGFWVATRHPGWFRAFVIGNTWAWPMRGERSTKWFSKALRSSVLGGLLVRRADVFVNVFMRGGIRRKKLTLAERQMYKRPHPSPASRVPVQVMPLAGAARDLPGDQLLPSLSHWPPRLLRGESEGCCRLDGRYWLVGRGGVVAVGHHLLAEGVDGRRPSGPGRPDWTGCSPG